ncbi:MAG: RNA polymerase sigma factor [Gemmataceae bacterium]
MPSDTEMGGPGDRFPTTRPPLMRALTTSDNGLRQQAFESLVIAYWKPVYKYIRVRRAASNEDAKDLTQAFFARALEAGYFDAYDPAKSRFRTFIRVCVDRFVSNEAKAAVRIKRGGQVNIQSLNFEAAEAEIILQNHSTEDEETFFHKEWIRSLFTLAVEALKAECAAKGKETSFALFERYDLDGPEAAEKLTYNELASSMNLPTTQVTNSLAWTRRRFRELVLEKLRHLTGSEEEFQAEARRLLGPG